MSREEKFEKNLTWLEMSLDVNYCSLLDGYTANTLLLNQTIEGRLMSNLGSCTKIFVYFDMNPWFLVAL